MAKRIDDFVRDTIREQYDRAKELLSKHRPKLDALAKVLLQKETMSVAEFLVIFEGRTPTEEEVKREEHEDKVAATIVVPEETAEEEEPTT